MRQHSLGMNIHQYRPLHLRYTRWSSYVEEIALLAPALGASCSWGKALDSVVLEENAHTNTIKNSYIGLDPHMANRIWGLNAWLSHLMEGLQIPLVKMVGRYRLDWSKRKGPKDI